MREKLWKPITPWEFYRLQFSTLSLTSLGPASASFCRSSPFHPTPCSLGSSYAFEKYFFALYVRARVTASLVSEPKIKKKGIERLQTVRDNTTLHLTQGAVFSPHLMSKACSCTWMLLLEIKHEIFARATSHARYPYMFLAYSGVPARYITWTRVNLSRVEMQTRVENQGLSSALSLSRPRRVPSWNLPVLSRGRASITCDTSVKKTLNTLSLIARIHAAQGRNLYLISRMRLITRHSALVHRPRSRAHVHTRFTHTRVHAYTCTIYMGQARTFDWLTLNRAIRCIWMCARRVKPTRVALQRMQKRLFFVTGGKLIWYLILTWPSFPHALPAVQRARERLWKIVSRLNDCIHSLPNASRYSISLGRWLRRKKNSIIDFSIKLWANL